MFRFPCSSVKDEAGSGNGHMAAAGEERTSDSPRLELCDLRWPLNYSAPTPIFKK